METHEEIEHLRNRLHKIADGQQIHEIKINEIKIRYEILITEVTNLRNSTVTTHQLEAAAADLESKINHIVDIMEPIRRGVYAAVGLILIGFLTAVIALVYRN